LKGKSKITQMIEDVNNEIDVNENLKNFGYGYIPSSLIEDKT